MKSILAALFVGLVMGLGLSISRMINPAKVLGFFDVAGHWDPTLAIVMGSALAVNAVGYWLVTKRPHPLFAAVFSIPTRKEIDGRLLGGAALFGVGWGMVGLCPGPAITSTVFGYWQIWLFVAAMIVGALGHDRLTRSER
jgi:uncharacterized membrane protein YedE/YeeE